MVGKFLAVSFLFFINTGEAQLRELFGLETSQEEKFSEDKFVVFLSTLGVHFQNRTVKNNLYYFVRNQDLRKAYMALDDEEKRKADKFLKDLGVKAKAVNSIFDLDVEEVKKGATTGVVEKTFWNFNQVLKCRGVSKEDCLCNEQCQKDFAADNSKRRRQLDEDKHKSNQGKALD